MTKFASINEILDVFDFFIALANQLGKEKIKKFNFWIILKLFLPLRKKLIKALNGIDRIGIELKDLDQDEIKALKGIIVEKLDLPDDKIEEIAEEIIKIVLDISKVFILVKKRKTNV